MSIFAAAFSSVARFIPDSNSPNKVVFLTLIPYGRNKQLAIETDPNFPLVSDVRAGTYEFEHGVVNIKWDGDPSQTAYPFENYVMVFPQI